MTRRYDIFWLNGQFLSVDQFLLSPFDRALTLGDGLFETCLWAGERTEYLAEHVKRLTRSCRVFDFDFSVSQQELESVIKKLVDLNKAPKGKGMPVLKNPEKENSDFLKSAGVKSEKAVVRITLSRGIGVRGLALPQHRSNWTMITLSACPQYKASFKLALNEGSDGFEFRRSRFSLTSSHKTLNYIDQIMAFKTAQKLMCDDYLMCDDRGFLSSSCQANLFFIKDGYLCTPSPECAILPGITRNRIIQCAEKQSIPVKEGLFKPDTLFQAEAVFISNSIRGMMPVSQINKTAFSSGQNLIFKALKTGL